MRTILVAIPLLALAACNVSKDGNSVTVEYDQNTAENAAAEAGNFAENVGGIIANDVDTTADKVQNEVGDVDVDVDVNRNDNPAADTNRQ
jgi:hypothetical protein